MNPKERDDIAHAVTQINAFYGKTLDELQIKLWVRALSRSDPARIKKALADYLAVGQYAPKPKNILDLIANDVETDSRNHALPKPETIPASPQVAAAWSWAIAQWGMGGITKPKPVTADQIEEYSTIVNEQAKASGNPDAIPPGIWRSDIWGCEAEAKQSEYIHR